MNVLFLVLPNSPLLSSSASENNSQDFSVCRLLYRFIAISGLSLQEKESQTGGIVNLKYFKLKGSCYCRRNSSAPIVNLVLSAL